MMSTKEMKEVLFQKLQDEECCFAKSDLSVTKHGEDVKVVVKGYEHCPFTIKTEEDDYFGFILYVYCDDEAIDFLDNKKEYEWERAIIHIGYYIGTRF